MIVLVVNSGSSSIKFQLFDMADEAILCKGIVKKIGTNLATLKMSSNHSPPLEMTTEILDHRIGISRILDTLTDPEFRIISDINEISAVGHRVVHGGEYFTEAVSVDENVTKLIGKCAELAPLHNPPALAGIAACRELLPDAPQVTVFDTAFHQSMEPAAFLYGLPYVLYERHKIRRYGFHGTSHQYAAKEAARFVGKDLVKLKIITCHLGNGASITAIEDGKSVDTSMGFTPLEGLIMGTRCGDLDPAIIPFLIEKDQLSSEGVNNLMNKHSGVYGIAGLSTGDMGDLEIAAEKNEGRAALARAMFARRVKKYIGSFTAVLGGIDLLVFTGGIGENDWDIREKIIEGMDFFGLELDLDRNRDRAQTVISKGNVIILVIKADEELVIARETMKRIESLR